VSGAHSKYGQVTLVVYVAALGLCGLLLAGVSKRGTTLAVAAGLLWAASDTSIKALSSHLGSLGFGVLIHPLALVILIASLLADLRLDNREGATADLGGSNKLKSLLQQLVNAALSQVGTPSAVAVSKAAGENCVRITATRSSGTTWGSTARGSIGVTGPHRRS